MKCLNIAVSKACDYTASVIVSAVTENARDVLIIVIKQLSWRNDIDTKLC